jgi:hypothetical protein
MNRNKNWLATLVLAATLGAFTCQATRAEEEEEKEYEPADLTALLALLPNSKLSLADGLKLASKGAGAPISAKFELDHDKKLSLSVYTAEKGLSLEPEDNVLKELSGSPEQDAWSPEIEVFKDKRHLTRASGQLVLVSLSPRLLLEIVDDASKRQSGTVYSITPRLQARKPVFVVLVAKDGKVTSMAYDLLTGKLAWQNERQ